MNRIQTTPNDMTVPQPDAEFRASRYIGVFDILSLRVDFTFDADLSSVVVKHSFVARKAHSGPNGWCVPYIPGTHEYYRFYDDSDSDLPARPVQDTEKHCYMVVDFRQNMRLEEVVRFKTETRQRVTSPMLQGETKREKSLFLSRVYGASCQDAEVTITMPRTYTIIQSIPGLKGKNRVYRHRMQVVRLEAVQIALVARRCLWPYFSRVFGRDTHPAVWALVGAVVGWVLSKLL